MNYIFVHLLDNIVFVIEARCKHEDHVFVLRVVRTRIQI